MPGTTGLAYAQDKGFNVTELFVSDTTGGTWSELETTNFTDDSVKVNPALGEAKKASIPTALALSRKVGDKDQKFIILGDADCISNGEISISRKGVQAANYNLILGAFYWMSDNEVPIDVRRPEQPDKTIKMGIDGVALTRWGFIGLFPLAMIIFYILLWIRRKGR